MSCCDGCSITIVNNSGTGFVVNNAAIDNGTLTSNPAIPPVGVKIPHGQTFAWQVESAHGTKGAASGTLTVGLIDGPSSVSLALQYSFTPKGSGSCPCTASTPPSHTSGNYKVNGTSSNGDSNGEASITWTLVSQLAEFG